MCTLYVNWIWINAFYCVIIIPLIQDWPNGLGVWFLLWVQEVPGSNPGLAQQEHFLGEILLLKVANFLTFCQIKEANFLSLCRSLCEHKIEKWISGDTRSWTKDLPDCSRMLYHWAISPSVLAGSYRKLNKVVISTFTSMSFLAKIWWNIEQKSVLSEMGFEPMPSNEDQKSLAYSLSESKVYTLSLAP